MSEPDNFLTRWSRRKLDAEKTPPAPKPTSDPSTDDGDKTGAVAQAGAELKPTFDPASLPPLESITGATDVRPFLMPGVPAELSRAALRRVWTADPGIRDFVGLAENAWDFTAPDGVPGFGELPAGLDIKKMVAEVFGELSKQETAETEPAPDEQVQPDGVAGQSATLPPPNPASLQLTDSSSPVSQVIAPAAGTDVVHRTSYTATQQDCDEDQRAELKPIRSHGGALPK